MVLDVREYPLEYREALTNSFTCLLVMPHRRFVIQRPEAHFRVNFKHPFLRFCCNRIINLSDFPRDTPSLLAQTFASCPRVRSTGIRVILLSQRCAARGGEDTRTS